VPAFAIDGFGARENQCEVRDVGVAGPYLRPRESPTATGLLGAGTDRSEIRSAVGLGHSDREISLAAGDAGEMFGFLRCRTVAQQGGAHLAVGEPVRGHGGSGGQQFLYDDVAFLAGPLGSPELPRKRHPDEAAAPQRPAEGRTEPSHPGVAVAIDSTGRHLVPDELAHLRTQHLVVVTHG